MRNKQIELAVEASCQAVRELASIAFSNAR